MRISYYTDMIFQGDVEEAGREHSKKPKGKVVKFGWIDGVYVS